MIKLTDGLWHKLTATALKILREALIALLCSSVNEDTRKRENKTDQSLPTVPSGPRLSHLLLHVSPAPKTKTQQTGEKTNNSFASFVRTFRSLYVTKMSSWNFLLKYTFFFFIMVKCYLPVSVLWMLSCFVLLVWFKYYFESKFGYYQLEVAPWKQNVPHFVFQGDSSRGRKCIVLLKNELTMKSYCILLFY